MVRHYYWRIFHTDRITKGVKMAYGEVLGDRMSVGRGYFIDIKRKYIRILRSRSYPNMVGEDYLYNDDYPHTTTHYAVTEIEGSGGYVIIPKRDTKLIIIY